MNNVDIGDSDSSTKHSEILQSLGKIKDNISMNSDLSQLIKVI
jgi:hypothetical protein